MSLKASRISGSSSIRRTDVAFAELPMGPVSSLALNRRPASSSSGPTFSVQLHATMGSFAACHVDYAHPTNQQCICQFPWLKAWRSYEAARVFPESSRRVVGVGPDKTFGGQ